MSDRLIQIKSPVAIAVEGQDYYHFLLAQIDGPPEFGNVQLFDFSAAGNFREWIRSFRTLRNFDTVKAIGIIRDAENSSAGMFIGIRDAFADNGFAPPTQNGEVVFGNPAVGILIIPIGQDRGCLENAILDACQADAPIECARSFLDCVDNSTHNDNWRAKVQVHALIAASSSPSITLGQSTLVGLWDLSRPTLRVMLEFILKLSGA